MKLDIVLFLSELYLDRHVPVLDAPPSPLSFYREYVSPNKPVLIRNGLQHWTANNKWTPQYLRFVPCGNALVSCAQDYIMTGIQRGCRKCIDIIVTKSCVASESSSTWRARKGMREGGKEKETGKE